MAVKNIKKIKTNIGLFYADDRDEFVTKELRETKDYSSGERHRYQVFLSPSSNVLWLGAHIGAHVVPLSKVVKSITAFEANPETYKLLEKNLNVNECSNVRSFNLAANDLNCDLKFICNTVNSGGSKRMPKQMHPKYLDHGTTFIDVQAVRLDDFLDEKNFDLIFLDIEGSETAALCGMPQILSRSSVLVTEFIPHHLTLVAGVSVEDFLQPISEFRTLMVPSMSRHVYDAEISPFLENMIKENQRDSGLIFHKNKIPVEWG